jgi:hypothetical protein
MRKNFFPGGREKKVMVSMTLKNDILGLMSDELNILKKKKTRVSCHKYDGR